MRHGRNSSRPPPRGGGRPRQRPNRFSDNNTGRRSGGNRGGGRDSGSGNARQQLDKYQKLARDAAAAGDQVSAERYAQYVEHYARQVSPPSLDRELDPDDRVDDAEVARPPGNGGPRRRDSGESSYERFEDLEPRSTPAKRRSVRRALPPVPPRRPRPPRSNPAARDVRGPESKARPPEGAAERSRSRTGRPDRRHSNTEGRSTSNRSARDREETPFPFGDDDVPPRSRPRGRPRSDQEEY